MEKRAVIAIAASFLILVAWTYIFPPSKPTPQAPPAQSEPAIFDEQREPEADESLPPVEGDAEAGPAEGAQVEPVSAASEEQITVGNRLFQVVLTNRGAALIDWTLGGEYATDDAPLSLVPRYQEESPASLSIELDDQVLADEINGALFQVERGTVSAKDTRGPGERITFRWSDGRGVTVAKQFIIFRDSWLVDVKLDVVDRGRRQPARLALGPGFAAQESRDGKSTHYYGTGARRGAQALWVNGGRVGRLRGGKLTKEDGGISGSIRWAGLEDQYFTALVLPATDQALVRWRSLDLTLQPLGGDDTDPEEMKTKPEPVVSVLIPATGAGLYIGPKNYGLLEELGSELEKTVWFSSNSLLYVISKYLFFALVWIHGHTIANYGVAIILATLLLRTLLFPLNQYAMVSMKKTQVQMQKLQPKVKGIKNKYKKAKDAQAKAKMNQEMMDLYKKEGVNPMGGVTGCLPLLAQFPILIGFYNMLTVAVELRGADFGLWIHDLSQKDPYYIIPLLMGVTMFVQQKLAMSKITDPMQQQQQKFMMFMPFVFTWICTTMPSGMVLYWFVNNLLGIGQQWLVNRHAARYEAATQKA